MKRRAHALRGLEPRRPHDARARRGPLFLHVEHPGAVGVSSAAHEERDAQAPEAPRPGHAEGGVDDGQRRLGHSFGLGQTLRVLLEGPLRLHENLLRQCLVPRSAHEAPMPVRDLGPRIEELLARALAHLLDERRDGVRIGGRPPPMEGGADVRVDEGVAQLQRHDAVGAHLATSQDEARGEANDVEVPGTDERVVEVVEVEDDAFLGARLLRLGGRQRTGPVRAEVLEVRVADEPPFARGPVSQRGVAVEDLVEERSRPAQHREGRSAHPGRLVRHQVRESRRPLVVDLELALGEADGIEREHRGGPEWTRIVV